MTGDEISQTQPGIESLRKEEKKKRLPPLSQRDFLVRSKHSQLELKEKLVKKADKSIEVIILGNSNVFL